jgi:DNA-binding PadR family transcriptional regulator
MPLRAADHIDPVEKFFIKRTEQALNQGFLWILILTQLNREPLRQCDLRRRIAQVYYFYHNRTLGVTLFLLRSMKLIQKRGKAYEITEKGKQVLERAKKHLKANVAIVLASD